MHNYSVLAQASRFRLKPISILRCVPILKARSLAEEEETLAAFDSGATRKDSITFARRANLAMPLPFRSCVILPQKILRKISVPFCLCSYKIAPETFHEIAGHLVIKKAGLSHQRRDDWQVCMQHNTVIIGMHTIRAYTYSIHTKYISTCRPYIG